MITPEGLDVDLIVCEVSRHFNVYDYFISGGDLVFSVSPIRDLKRDFMELYGSLRGMGYMPFLTKEGEGIYLHVRRWVTRGKRGFGPRHIALLAATVGTVMLDGYLRSENPYLYSTIPGYNPIATMLIFTAALLGIIGAHELGHKIVLHVYGIRASWPYFIPGIPGVFPTFGAVIAQEDIPPNRDRLFDAGIAGPIAGLAVTILVAVYAIQHAPMVSLKELSELQARLGGRVIWFPVPVLYLLLQNALRPVPEGYVVLVDPLTWAAIVGMAITALNIFPAWQLDGGHLARAVLGARYHNYATLASILILLMVGYYMMALFILFMYMVSGGVTVRPLDDVSPVSGWRKALFGASWIIAALCLPYPRFA